MSAPPKILVLEEDAELREAIVESLRDQGYEALDASSGIEALALLKQFEPCLVLVDLRFDGEAFVDDMRRNRVAAPIVLMTPSGRPPTPERPIHRYLKKPFDLDELMQIVHAHCRGTLRASDV